VLGWAERYTRGLPPAIAGSRRDELASDLWEQGADARRRGRSGVGTAVSILSRAVRGIPADLAWRRVQLAGGAPEPRAIRRERRVASAGLLVAVLVGLAVAAVGLAALVRIGIVLGRHGYAPSGMTMSSTALGTVAVLCGLVLLLRRRTRWIGAVWLAGSSAVVGWFATVALEETSSTAQSIIDGLTGYPVLPLFPLIVAIGIAGIAAFDLALAVAWFPGRKAARA